MTGKKGWWSALIYACFVLLGLYLTAYQSVADVIAREFGLSASLMGALVAMHFVGSMLAPPSMGRLADARGPRLALPIACLAIVAGLAITCVSRAAWQVCAGILVTGCGFAALEGLMTSALAAANPERAAGAVSRSQMWFCVGAVIAPALCARALKMPGGWRLGYLLVALLFAAAAACLSRAPFEKPAPSAEPEAVKPARPLWRRGLLLALCAAMAAYVGVEQGTAFFLTSYFSGIGEAGLSEWALTAYWLGMIVGRFGGGLLRRGHRAVSVAGLAAAALCEACILLFADGAAACALFGAMGLLIACTWPTLASLPSAHYPEQGGAATGLMMTAGAVGGAAFNLLMGVLSGSFGVTAAFWLLPALTIVAAALTAASSRIRA